VTETAQSIELGLSAKLRDREYRRRFFLAETSARIASQLIALRKRRGLSQKQVAELAKTQQPAISRAEKADYQNWSFNTLRGIAEALDARIRVFIEPSEDILVEYEGVEKDIPPNGLRAEKSSQPELLASLLTQNARQERLPAPSTLYSGRGVPTTLSHLSADDGNGTKSNRL
jgi:transcriptional regulator with XRE-family HTH domain